jgi:Na+/pantothenate symporter
MGMTSSDVNTNAAVITRDILPVISKRFGRDDLRIARITTFVFTVLTLIVALNYERFGGVLGLIVKWFAALLGPTAMPLLFGLLPVFRRCGSFAAIASIVSGMLAFVLTKNFEIGSMALEVGLPSIVAAVVFIVSGFFAGPAPREVDELMEALSTPTEAAIEK